MELVNRILKFIPHDCMVELNAICRDRTIPDNNTKADLMRQTLTSYNVPFRELGPGTNRYAVRIDGVVFKIAMDKYGIDDNRNEMAMSDQLQPFAAKTLSMDKTGLIITSEYVTVISKAEFAENEATIKAILSQLAERYLFGDIGFTLKNFVNWGYRENGDLVILDYGYIYRVVGNEVTCTNMLSDDVMCGEFLDYDAKFSDLVCPKCRKKYTYDDIRKRVDRKLEQAMVQQEIDKAYLINTVTATVDDGVDNCDTPEPEPTTDGKDEADMYIIDEEEYANAFSYAVEHAGEIVSHAQSCSNDDDIPLYDDDDIDYDDEDELVDDETENECDWLDDDFDTFEIFGNLAIFTNARIRDDDYIPEGYNKYHLRECDESGFFVELNKNVFVNHGGTIIINGEIDPSILPITLNGEDYGFSPDDCDVTSMTLREYMNMCEPDAVIIDDDTIERYRYGGCDDEEDDDTTPYDDDGIDYDDEDELVDDETENECNDIDIDSVEDPEDINDESDDDDDDFEEDPDDVIVRESEKPEPETEQHNASITSCVASVSYESSGGWTDDDDDSDTTISDAIEEITEEETNDVNIPVDLLDEDSDDLDVDEVIAEAKDEFVGSPGDVITIDESKEPEEGMIDADVVKTVWTDPNQDIVADMRAELAKYAEEDEEEEDRHRSKNYKHNKRNNYR